MTSCSPRPDLEALVAEFGERHRRLIAGALSWLDKQPWSGLIDRREFIRDLIEHQKKE